MSGATTSGGPLAGLRVVEFGHWLAGPMAGLLLADQGAEVVSVRRPGAAERHPAERILHRGKRCIELDLKSEVGRSEALALVNAADVVIENFRPGVMARLGLGYDQVRQDNPQIIYASLPGFSESDARASMPGWEGVIAANAALFTDISFWGAAFSLPPVFTALPLASAYSALHAAIGVTAAVFGRLRDGRGDRIEAPLLDGAMSASAGPLMRTKGQPKRYNEPGIPTVIIDHLNLRRLPGVLASGVERFLDGQMPPFFRSYACADGRDLFILVIDNIGHIDRLLSAMGIADELESMGLRRGNILDVPPTDDNVYAYRSNTSGMKQLAKRLEALFLTRSALEWEDHLGRHGVPAAVQRTTAEWTGFGPIREAGIVVAHDDDEATILAPGHLVDISASDHGSMPLPQKAAAPVFTGWTSDGRFFANAPEPAESATPPLSGLRILDLANVIAGPVASRTLAELGAEVLHIDPINPKMGPRMLLFIGQEVNQGKDAAIIDLKNEATKPIVDRLIERSDAVIYNKLPHQAAGLGFDPDRVHAAKPDCVITAVTAYGGSLGKGWGDRPAYDPVVQAMSGIMVRYGGLSSPEVHGVAATIDYFTGFAGTLSALCGFVARERGARNIVTRTSLARTAAWIQLPFITGRPVAEPSGQNARGWDALNSLYRSSDGWIYLALEPDLYLQARPSIEAAMAISLPDRWQDASETLAKAFEKRKAAELVRALQSPILAIAEVLDVRALREKAEPGAWADTLVTTDLPSGRTLLVPQGEDRGELYVPDSTWLRWGSRPRRRLHASHLPGADTVALLEALMGAAPATLPSGMSSSWDLSTGPLPT
ncbi:MULTISPECIES: CoA transferase [Sphingomonas]|jgi:crotonobetainyl-CoA:carnitine CoA-transferase CaiB-like acyl-CoA transferase|uniref:CoA transferase n=1 Tax=Sphingomonas zeae TaxID=1646122 RepID=A0A7Y6B3A6_9SPHN|nr:MULTISPECIES: CoA transferase [Sphingomonas]MBB4050011.1 crotonobetainyl-CoA:carnitine CoA-transferase CaiB-like acyl-CoA transferase [Sphingomonas zeae]MDK8184241.1 CoA transferase [Sphingomonas zeae]MDK8218034.1 CoA transferase [Sphingomonas sp. UMB7805-LC452B]NUU45707.1 hypothetical protein [Sphingomonas zeae]